MKNKVKIHTSKQVSIGHFSLNAWLPIIYTILCIILSVVICSACALLEVVRQNEKTRIFANASDSKTDKIRIFIDQGHNPLPYHNIGAEGNGLYEQDLTFSIGCLLAERLVDDGRFEVCLSRPDKTTVLGYDTVTSLKSRVDSARDFEADYFISLHINSYVDKAPNGLEVFVSTGDSESSAFGKAMLEGMVASTNLKSRGLKESSELYVLENTDVPAALLEMGFISNVEDAVFLSEHPDLFAEGIYNGIVDYFENGYISQIKILLCIISVSLLLAFSLIITILIIKKKLKMKNRTTKGVA